MILDGDKSLIEDFLNDMRRDIISVQASKGIRASGKSADGLEVRVNDDAGQLVDTAGYFEYEQYGRGPSGAGSGGGEMTLQQRIYEWLQYKKYGIDYANDKQRLSISWAIATKIHQKGTLTFINNSPTGVLTEVINMTRINSLTQAIKDRYRIEILTDVIREFKVA